MKTLPVFDSHLAFDDAQLALLPVEWDATTSFRQGTAAAPDRIRQVSSQLDFFRPDYADVRGDGIVYLEPDSEIQTLNKQVAPLAKQVMDADAAGTDIYSDPDCIALQEQVNAASEAVNDRVYAQAEALIKENKMIGLLGGDHSCSLGLVRALVDYIDSFAVLQIDAHMDLRPSYQGFVYSHASVMHHVMEHSDISRLIQVGVRDYSAEEYYREKDSKGKIKTYYNEDIAEQLFMGKSWDAQCKKIINNCPENVYLSVDIDGFLPAHCPNTGTPVPGGLSYDQVCYLIKKLVDSGRTIIGFDLVEVNGEANSLDVITAAHLLYTLCGYTWLSQED